MSSCQSCGGVFYNMKKQNVIKREACQHGEQIMVRMGCNRESKAENEQAALVMCCAALMTTESEYTYRRSLHKLTLFHYTPFNFTVTDAINSGAVF